ncbi:MAG TPA: plastocyanin/azurin family copper-binding protein [Solirubrobacterales bacterium]
MAGAACLALAGTVGAGAPAYAATAAKPKVVEVADFFFAPSAVTIRKEGKVKWVWAATNVESHDVHLKQGPKSLKKKATYSTKTTAVTNATFVKAFPTPGSYRFICTIHPTKMKMTVTVKK